MVDFKTRVYTESEDDIIGAEVLVYSDGGEEIGSIEIVNAEDLNDLAEQLAVIDETYFTEERLATILANAQETNTINATTLSGFQSSDLAKVSQLSSYALASHTHTKNQITNLYNYELTSSDYNPSIGDSVTLSAKVTDMAGQPVSGQTLTLYKNGVSTQNTSITNNQGIANFTVTSSDFGIVDYNVMSSHLQLRWKGWKTVVYDRDNHFSIISNGETAYLYMSGVHSTTSNTVNNFYVFAQIPREYSPKNIVYCNLNPLNNDATFVLIDNDGYVASQSQFTNTSVNIRVEYSLK